MQAIALRFLLSFCIFLPPFALAQQSEPVKEAMEMLRQTLEACRKENERLRKLLPDSLQFAHPPNRKPLQFRANNITYYTEGKSVSMYQIITELPIPQAQQRVVAFLNSRGYQGNFETTDTLVNDVLVLPELHPVKVKARWAVEEYEPGFSMLKIWIRMPDGTWLNPDNYPGYHTAMTRILRQMFNGAE